MDTHASSASPRAPRQRQAFAFALVVAVVVGGLGLISERYRERLDRNSEVWLADRINMMLPPGSFDNDPVADVVSVRSPDLLGSEHAVPVYRARRRASPTAAVIASVAPDGYGGPLRLLVAVDYDGKILGVQVIEHHETPGLADPFVTSGSDWLQNFVGRRLTESGDALSAWRLRKDGGTFDHISSASVTPRALLRAVEKTLEYYNAHREALYADDHP